MTTSFWIAAVTTIALLVAAAPLVARIRHPRQRPLAAYLVFALVFVASAAFLFALLAWLASVSGLGPALEEVVPAALFLLLVLLPAAALAAWQARKPPSPRGPPD